MQASQLCAALLPSEGGAQEWLRRHHCRTPQVLLSIQGMILIGDPYYNEPSVDKMRGTAEGTSTSAEYNFGVQLNTMRWAMIDQLRNPPPGFEVLSCPWG